MGVSLERKTWMPRGKGFERNPRNSLKRGTGLSRASQPSRSAWKRKRSGSTDPSPAMKAAVRKRDDFACARCGINVLGRNHSIHHRVRRSQGGRNTMENLVTLCGDGVAGCHGWVHGNVAAARTGGWILLGSDNPALEGVTYAGEIDPQPVLWLTRDGKRITADPRDGVAA